MKTVRLVLWIMLALILVGAIVLVARSCFPVKQDLHDNANDKPQGRHAASADCESSRDLFVYIERSPSISDQSLGLLVNGKLSADALEPVRKVFEDADVRIRFYIPPDHRVQAPGIVDESTLQSELLRLENVDKNDPKTVGCEVDVHVLVVPSDTEGPKDFGLMFDYGVAANGSARQGLALYWNAIERRKDGPAGAFLRFLAHELSHVVNAHHQDFEPAGFIGGQWHQNNQFSSLEGQDWKTRPGSPYWTLSSYTRNHIVDGPRSYVMPGPTAEAFLCVTTPHLNDHHKSPAPDAAIVPQQSGVERSCKPDPHGSAGATQLARPNLPNEDGVNLSISSDAQSYVPGDYVVVRGTISNWGAGDIQIPVGISAESSTLRLLIKAPDALGFRQFSPPLFVDSFTEFQTLSQNQSYTFYTKIFFGADGWTMTRPGTYEVQTDMVFGVAGTEKAIASNVITLRVDGDDVAAKRCGTLLKTANGSNGSYLLQDELGIYLYLGGAPHLSETERRLQQALKEYPDCEILSGVRLAMAQTEARNKPSASSISRGLELLDAITPGSLPIEIPEITRTKLCQSAEELSISIDSKLCREVERPKPQLHDPAQNHFQPGTIQGVFYFAKNSAVLQETDVVQAGQLRRIVDSLHWDLKRAIRLIGRADSIGQNNDWLSWERARAARDTFLVAGVSPTQISQLPCGSIGAAPPSAPEGARAGDRRVDLVATSVDDPLHRNTALPGDGALPVLDGNTKKSCLQMRR
jgi:outer membrane protein OmpA-like peptidoglycan-associated protein